jgi:hypothetical protein
MRMAAEGGIVDIMITFPAEYMLKDGPEERLSNSVDSVGITLQENCCGTTRECRPGTWPRRAELSALKV